jgi:dCMP deaminase
MQKIDMPIIIDLIATAKPVAVGGVYKSAATIQQSIMATIAVWAKLRSKDPNTYVGAAVYDKRTGALHMGYNGFPSGVEDTAEIWDNRDMTNGKLNKYQVARHGEANAIHKAWVAGFNPEEAELYLTHYPCMPCAKDFIIPSKIKTIYVGSDYGRDVEVLKFLASVGIVIKEVSFVREVY